MGCHSLVQGIFPTLGSNPGLHITGRFFTIWATRDILFGIRSDNKSDSTLHFFKKNEFAKLIYSSSDSGYQPDSMFGNKIKGPGFGRFQSRSEEKAWHPTLVPLPGESHGRRSLVGCSPWSTGREESDMTERLHFHFSLSDIGEGNGNPLQCSCLENPWDGGAWWAAIYGAAQSRTRLKRLSSSSLDLRILR